MSIDAIGYGNWDEMYDENSVKPGEVALEHAVLQLSGKVDNLIQTVATTGRWPDCPPNYQWPVCMNRHKAVLVCEKSDGSFYRWLCNYSHCNYEFHYFSDHYLAPGLSIKAIDPNKNYFK